MESLCQLQNVLTNIRATGPRTVCTVYTAEKFLEKVLQWHNSDMKTYEAELRQGEKKNYQNNGTTSEQVLKENGLVFGFIYHILSEASQETWIFPLVNCPQC